jgi:DNA replication protein DnaC
MLSHPLLPKLKQLRLSGMACTLEERAGLASATAMTPVDFFALLIEDEIERREQKRNERLVKRAGFEQIKLLAQFDFAAAPTLDRSLVAAMATCQFIRNHENWLMCGSTGLGKSHIAVAIGYEAIKRGHTVLFADTHQLLKDLFAARADATYAKTLGAIIGVDLLILDEFGLKPVSPQGAQDLYDIIHKRYERGSIILTSNRAPSEWHEIFGDGLLASAALDRLTHHARITCLSGKSYRQRNRKPMDLAASPEGESQTAESDTTGIVTIEQGGTDATA